MLGDQATRGDGSQVDFHDKSQRGRCHDNEAVFDLEDDGGIRQLYME
jgi:hypothetical protein